MKQPTDAPTGEVDVAVATPAGPAEPPSPAGDDVPCLAGGVELIGLFEDSGFKEAPYIARRGDGQIIQLAPMLFMLAEQVDGRRTLDEVAEAFSERIQRGVDAAMVSELLDTQLRRLGIVAMADGQTGEVEKLDPLLALKFRTKVIPDSFVRSITTVFKPLFLPPVLAVALLAFAALDVWLFGVHGISQGLRHVLYQPALLFMLMGGVVLATAFHEVGHATAVRYGGAKPGVMGVGVYIVWPAFYTDITDAYRLGKWGRLRADCGGMYFNTLFALAAGAAYALTGFEPILLLIVLQNFAIIQQSLPFLRLDGYYIVSDLTGVPDMFYRIKPVLRSLLPGRPEDDRVSELRPRAKRVVTAYVLVTVPVLILVFALMLVHAPRAFATGYDSVALHYRHAGPAFGDGRPLAGIMDVVQMLVLVLPGAGFVYTLARMGRAAAPAAWSWSAHEPWRRPALAGGTLAAVGVVAFLWWPHGEYRPIQPGERGTLVSAVKSLKDVPGGRASLTPQRQRQLKGAPLRSDALRTRRGPGSESRARRVPGGDTSTTTTPTTATTTPSSTTTTTTSPTTTVTTPATATPAPAETTPADATAPAAPTDTTPAQTTPAPAPTTTTTTTPAP